jgi:hypothetical protein
MFSYPLDIRNVAAVAIGNGKLYVLVEIWKFATAVFFSYADPSEKFHFSNRYNFYSDELFRLKSTKASILSGVLLLLAHNYSLRCLVSILDFKIYHLGRHRKKNTAVNSTKLKSENFICTGRPKILCNI